MSITRNCLITVVLGLNLASASAQAPSLKPVAAKALPARPAIVKGPTGEALISALAKAARSKEYYVSAMKGDEAMIRSLLTQNGIKAPIKIITGAAFTTYTGPPCIWTPVMVWDVYPTTYHYDIVRVCDRVFPHYPTDIDLAS